MIIAILELTVSPEHDAETRRWLRSFYQATNARPGCIGGGVYHASGSPKPILYLEMWQQQKQLEAHIRSPEYDRLLAIMETSASPPALTFGFLSETRGLEWVEAVRRS